MSYPSYLIHFNRLHDPKTGKFIFGDGDGDGVRNDHRNQGKTSLNKSAGNKTFEVKPNRNFTREGTGKTVRAGDTKVGNYVNRNFTREGTGKTVRAGDTKVGNYVNRNFTREGTGSQTPIEDEEKLVDSAKNQEVDTQKVTNREATEIFVMRALGQTLNSLYIDDYDERREKNKELLERTNTKNWNK